MADYIYDEGASPGNLLTPIVLQRLVTQLKDTHGRDTIILEPGKLTFGGPIPSSPIHLKTLAQMNHAIVISGDDMESADAFRRSVSRLIAEMACKLESCVSDGKKYTLALDNVRGDARHISVNPSQMNLSVSVSYYYIPIDT